MESCVLALKSDRWHNGAVNSHHDGAFVSDPHSATQIAFYDVPLPLWLTLLATIMVSVLSAVTAMIVVWRSNANSRRNLREQLALGATQFGNQLEHDSRQLERKLAAEATERVREREMSLRREVYLEAASALVHLQTLLGQASNIEYEQKDLMAAFAEDQATIAKTHIVGSQATVAAVMGFIGEFGPAFLELITRRPALMIRKSAIETHASIMEKRDSERSRFLEMMQQYNLDWKNEPARFEAMKTQYEFANTQYEAHSGARLQLLGEQAREQMTVAERVVELGKRTATRLPDAVLAVRSEMEMPLDRTFYEAQWQDQIRKMDEAWAAAKARLSVTFQSSSGMQPT